jgi:hypothetical protein
MILGEQGIQGNPIQAKNLAKIHIGNSFSVGTKKD